MIQINNQGDTEQITNQSMSSYPPAIDPLQKIPEELTPEDYLLNSENLLDMDQPESLRNNYFLFSPLLPVLAFVIFSMTVIGVYVNNRQEQVADIRNKAAAIPCAQGSDLRCTNPGNSCGNTMICTSGQHPENANICDCVQVSPTPVITTTQKQTTVTRSEKDGLMIGIITTVIIIGVLVLYNVGRKKQNESNK